MSLCLLFLVFCFFFFKQKTAYEMRISDWSSDVCSSDLETGIPAPDITSFAEMLTSAASACYYGWTGIGQHANATQIDRAIATLFALKGQVDAPGGNVAWPAPKTNPIDDPGLLSPEPRQKTLGLAEQIGRASCRERV